MNETSWIQVNRSALAANVRWWRSWLGDARLCAVVKADAYGLGCRGVVKTLAEHVDAFAVFSPQQAEQVLAADDVCQRPVLVFMPSSHLTWSHPLQQAAAQGRLWLSIHSLECLGQLERLATHLPGALQVHLFIDTGMSRAGLSPAQLPSVWERIARADSRLRIAGIYTHFATADDDAARLDWQMQRFAGLPHCPGVVRHAANTFAALRGTRYHLDMVRIGLGLYGYGPQLLADPCEGIPAGLQPAVAWYSRVMHLGRYACGQFVGYNAAHRLARDSLLATVPVGYADGYPLGLSGKGQVELLDQAGQVMAVPVVGRVNMDQIVIDVTDCPQVKLGQVVELLSDRPESACYLPRVAALAGSHCYDVLTGLSPRVPRRWDCP